MLDILIAVRTMPFNSYVEVGPLSKEDIKRLIYSGRIRLWVIYLKDPVYAKDSFYTPNYTITTISGEENYSVYSIYMLKDFEGTMEDYEIAMEVLFSNVSTYNVHRDWNQTVQEVANG